MAGNSSWSNTNWICGGGGTEYLLLYVLWAGVGNFGGTLWFECGTDGKEGYWLYGCDVEALILEASWFWFCFCGVFGDSGLRIVFWSVFYRGYLSGLRWMVSNGGLGMIELLVLSKVWFIFWFLLFFKGGYCMLFTQLRVFFLQGLHGVSLFFGVIMYFPFRFVGIWLGGREFCLFVLGLTPFFAWSLSTLFVVPGGRFGPSGWMQFVWFVFVRM